MIFGRANHLDQIAAAPPERCRQWREQEAAPLQVLEVLDGESVRVAIISLRECTPEARYAVEESDRHWGIDTVAHHRQRADRPC